IDAVGIHDDFFALGGHSLLATQLISRVRDALNVELPLRELFQAPTIAGMAEAIQKKGRRPSAPPIKRVPRDRSLPLSFAQQRLWFLDRLIPGKAFYNLPAGVRLKGPLDVDAIRKTFAEIVRRHEVLRTSFPLVEGHPEQAIAAVAPVAMPVIDLSTLRPAARERATQALAGDEATGPFDLARGPLIRIRLLRLGEAEHVAFVTMHHIVADGWSMGVLTREVGALYHAFSRGLPSPLPELNVQYADFASWQREWLEGEVLREEIDHWKAQLEGTPPLELPTDRPRPAVSTFRGGKHLFALPASVASRLHRLRFDREHTLFMVLLAAFQTLLSRYTGQADVAVGTPIANRTRSETESLIGFFVNTLVLRTDLSGNPSFRELLQRVRSVCIDAYAHQDLPFEKLVDALNPERDMSRHPLVSVMFALQNAPLPVVQLPTGVTLQAVESDSRSAKFDLLVSTWTRQGGLFGFVEYSADLFDSSTIARMFGHFATLVAGLSEDPEARLSDPSLLTAAERHQLLSEWNRLENAPARDREGSSLPRIFEAQVERTPDRVALVGDHEKLSYRELDRRANGVARRLAQRGVGPEIRVGVCAARSPELVVALLGILKAGGAYVPLDPEYP
ncbi:MAG TPA: condensation domain-containing protein, partial [Vicinamibacteria bacterium]